MNAEAYSSERVTTYFMVALFMMVVLLWFIWREITRIPLVAITTVPSPAAPLAK